MLNIMKRITLFFLLAAFSPFSQGITTKQIIKK